MITKNAFLFIISLLFLTPAWGKVADAPWPMLQHDLFHQGFSTSYGPNLNYAAVTFSSDIQAEGTATPVVDKDGSAYIGSKNGCFYKVQTDGAVTCIFEGIVGAVPASAALADDGTLYIGTTAGNLYAITTGGFLKWVFTQNDPIFSSPSIGPDGMIFFGTGPLNYTAQGSLYCITPEGKINWSYATGAVGTSSPAVDRYGNIYICSYNGTVHAVSGSGMPLWSYADNGTITSSPVLAQDGTVYIATSSKLIALDFDLSFKWAFVPISRVLGVDLESGIMGSPALDPSGHVIVGGMLGDMHCVDTDGHKIWSRIIKKLTLLGPIPVAIRSSPIIDQNGTIYVRSQNYIYALDPAKGFITGRIRLSPSSRNEDIDSEGSPVLGTRRMLYAAAQDGYLYAAGPSRRMASVSGAIKGDIPAAGMKVLVHTDSGFISSTTPEVYEAAVAADGSYTVPDLYPGSYIVSPMCQNPFMPVEPDFRKIFLFWGQDKTGIDFALLPPDTTGQYPSISMAEATPNPLLIPEEHTLHIEAKILAATPVTWAIDLSELGSLPDNASTQTDNPAQATCSWNIDVTDSALLGPRVLMVSATDTYGRVAQKPVFVDFQHKNIQGIDAGDNADFSETIPQQPFEGSLFKILFKYSGLPAGPSPKRPAGGTQELAGSGIGQVLLRIFSPSNTTGTPDYEVPVTAQQQELQINNAENGQWTVNVTNSTGTDIQCDLSSTIAGTGIVFGTVVDAESHAPVNGVNIQTSSGTSATTQNGVYVLLSPSGVFSLTTSSSKYMPTTKSVNLNAGSSVEKNILLIPSNFSDNATTCLATAVLGPASDKLDLLRQFRDTCLKKTPLGTAYSNTYYRFSPEITAMIAADPALRAQVQETLEAILPFIRVWVQGSTVVSPAFPEARVRACLKAFRSTASPELAREIDMGLKLLATGQFGARIGLAR